MNYEVDLIRAKFPGLMRSENKREAVFFDNPAGTQMAQPAIDYMLDVMINSNANLGGLFTTSVEAEKNVDLAHAAAADFVNAYDEDEIFFGQNMTTLTFAISRAIGRTLKAGDEILLTRMEHDANVAPWLMLAEDLGLKIKWLDFDIESFEFDLANLEELLSDRLRVVAINYASNVTGTINDVKTISAAAKQCGAFVYVDAVQYAPHGVIDVQDIDCDFLLCSAYKFYGPHFGLAWGRKSVQEELTAYKVRPVPDAVPFKFETGTVNREGLAGIRGAIDHFAWVGENFGDPKGDSKRAKIVSGVTAMGQHDEKLVTELIEGLQTFHDVAVLGITNPDDYSRRVPTVSFRAAGVNPEEIARFMGERGIYVWHGHNYAIEPCQRLGVLDDGGVLRVGPTHYNTSEEVAFFLTNLEECLKR